MLSTVGASRCKQSLTFIAPLACSHIHSRLSQSNNAYKEQLTRIEAQANLDGSSVIPLQFQVQRLNTELDNLQAHSGWLEDELRSKAEDLAATRASRASDMAQLRGQVEAATTEKEELAVRNQHLNKQLEALQKKTDGLSRQVREARQDAIDTKLTMEEELGASRRLADLQKEQLERIQQRHDSMADQMQQLKALAAQAENEGDEREREQERQMKAVSRRAMHDQADDYERQIEAMKQEIDDANRRCKLAEDGLLAAETPATIEAAAGANSARLALPPTAATDDEDGPLNLTDLYARVAAAESSMNVERLKRKKTEIMFARLEAEIQSKAPMLIRQRQEYELAMERQAEYKKRMESALDEASAARNESSGLQSELGRLRTKNKELTQECKELAKQVQQMLIARSTETTNPTVPQTVAQMQGANQRLLKEYKILTDRNKELEQMLKDNDLSQQVESFKKEVASLREDRRRQEIMVESIVQQRDLYRTLLNKQDSNILGGIDETSAMEVVKRQSNRSKALEEEHKKLAKDLAEAQGQLSAVARDKEIASERLQRYEALNGELTSSVDRLQLELSIGRAAVARSEADSAYHKEKAERLEESQQRGRQEIDHLTSAKNRLMEINSGLEIAVSKANAESSKLEGELRQAKSKMILIEAQSEAAKAAERRMFDESNQLRNEISRQGAMIESIQRIEVSLSSRNDSDMEAYKLEVSSLKEKLAVANRDHSAAVEDLKGKISDQETQIKELEDSRAKASREALNAKKESVEMLKKIQEATLKSSKLEIQLKAAKKKLGEIESDDPDTEVALNSKIAALFADLESAKNEIGTLTKQVATYQKLAHENESAVADMTEAANLANKAHADEIAQVKEELEHANAEMMKRKEVITELTNDLAGQRAEREKAVNEVKNQVAALKASVEEFKSKADDAESRYLLLQDEVTVLRADLATSQGNYERELGLHAAARTELRTVREEAENDSRLRKTAEQEASRLQSELEMQQSVMAVEKSEREAAINEYEKNLQETRAQNSLLHGQLEAISDQIDKMQSRRLVVGDADEDSKTVDASDDDEMSRLRQTDMELRELVKFVRSEKDAIQAQLDASRRAMDRERAQLSVARRNLDDARAELKVFQESSQDTVAGATADITLFKEKFKAAEEQCRLLGDSNAHLQQQVRKLEENLSRVRLELEKANKDSHPAKQIQKELESDKAALLAEKESLLREIEDWKGRVQSLVSKFNQIDPEEHAKVVKKAEEMEKQIKLLETSKTEAEDEAKRIRALASRASSQLQQNRQLVENHQKSIAKLTAEKEALMKSQNDVASKKEVDDLKEKVAKLEKDRDDEKIQLKGASEMNEKLRERLRQFQKIIFDLKKKEATLTLELKQSEVKLKDAQTELTKQPSPAATAESKDASKTKEPTTLVKSPVEANKTEEKPDPASDKIVLVPQAELKTVTTVDKKVANAVPQVPAGGFKFGPSETQGGTVPAVVELTKQPPAPLPVEQEDAVLETKVEPLPSKKRPGDPFESEEPDRKKRIEEETSNQTTGKTALSEVNASDAAASSSPDPLANRKMSGEKKEMSMKEKLLEKKRKLMETMKKAKEEKLKQQQQEAAEAAEVAAEPEAKRIKVVESEKAEVEASIQASKPPVPGLDPAAKSFVPGFPSSSSVPEDEGAAEDVEEGELEEIEVADSKEETAPASTPAPTFLPTTFASGATATPFGSSFGVGATPTFGQASTFGAGGAFGSGVAPGSLSAFGSSGFGVQNTGEGGGSAGFGSGSFLNMKPPSSSTGPPQFSFGTSSSITLPTPSSVSPQASMFNAFASPPANPFGGQPSTSASSSKPLFGFTRNVAKDESKDETEEGEMLPDSEEKS